MKLISIDVGIINLAYCILEIYDSNKYKIIDWNIVNLSNNTNRICRYCDNNGCCKKNAVYFHNNMYYCKKHAKKTDYIIPTADMNIKKIKKLKVGELHKLCDEKNIDFPKKSTKQDVLNIISNHIDNSYLSIIESQKTASLDLISVGRNIQIMLDKYLKDHFSSLTHVIIENQIAPKANRMKSIQGMITQYFIMKTTTIIEYISSENKLKHIDKTKLTYSERKKIAIDECKKIIYEKEVDYKDFFDNHKKKDDLSDCFLQGAWYLNKYLSIRNT